MAVLLATALAGCAGESRPTFSPTPSTSSSPIFSSTASAEAAAKSLYKRYLSLSQSLAESGGRDFGQMSSILTARALQAEKADAAVLVSKDLRTVGPTSLRAFKLQRADLKTGVVIAYACVDLAKVKVIDASGKDITPKSRPTRQTSLPSFVSRDGELLLDINGTWSGKSVC